MAYKILVYSDMQSAPWGGSEVLWSRLMDQPNTDLQFGLTCYSSPKAREIRKRHPNTSTYLIPEFLAAHYRTLSKRILCKATHRWCLRAGRKLSLLAQKRFMEQFRPDAVFASLPWPLGGEDLRTVLAHNSRIPYVCFLHSMAREYMTCPVSPELLAFYRKAHLVLTTGHRSGQLLQEWLGVPLQNILPTHNSVDCSTFYGTPRVRPWPTNGPRMVSIGRFSHEKGYDVLVRALAPLRNVPWTLDMIGDGPLYAEIAALTRQLGLQDKIRLFGQMDEDRIPEFLRECDVFVLPSRIEGMPLSLLEAMASGLACVATDVGSIHEVLIHNSSGLLVPPGNEEALRLAIQWLIDNQRECVRLGQAARETVVGQCDEGPFVARILRILQEAVSLGSRRHEEATAPPALPLPRNAEQSQRTARSNVQGDIDVSD
jgi:glycosyltransferase involved in cell wall biosynthesis